VIPISGVQRRTVQNVGVNGGNPVRQKLRVSPYCAEPVLGVCVTRPGRRRGDAVTSETESGTVNDLHSVDLLSGVASPRPFNHIYTDTVRL
jgi:hypothetical protein